MSVENSVKPFEGGNEAVWHKARHHQAKWQRCDLKHSAAMGNFYNTNKQNPQVKT